MYDLLGLVFGVRYNNIVRMKTIDFATKKSDRNISRQTINRQIIF